MHFEVSIQTEHRDCAGIPWSHSPVIDNRSKTRPEGSVTDTGLQLMLVQSQKTSKHGSSEAGGFIIQAYSGAAE